MAANLSMTDKREAILAEERRIAHRVASQVIDKPKLGIWMILIPIFFVFYFWQLRRYADGRRTFAEKFLITRQRALDEAWQACEADRGPDVEPLVRATDVPAPLHAEYRRWVIPLTDHYRDLIRAHGSSYDALIRSVYKNRTNYLLFLNQLNQVEREFNAALKPHLDPGTENINSIIKLMEESTAAIRRERAEEIFP